MIKIKYIFSVSIQDVEADSQEEAWEIAKKAISEGDYDLEIVDVEE